MISSEESDIVKGEMTDEYLVCNNNKYDKRLPD